MVFLQNGSWIKLIYEYSMNIGLFGANFNLILDKKGFFRESNILAPASGLTRVDPHMLSTLCAGHL